MGAKVMRWNRWPHRSIARPTNGNKNRGITETRDMIRSLRQSSSTVHSQLLALAVNPATDSVKPRDRIKSGEIDPNTPAAADCMIMLATTAQKHPGKTLSDMPVKQVTLTTYKVTTSRRLVRNASSPRDCVQREPLPYYW